MSIYEDKLTKGSTTSVDQLQKSLDISEIANKILEKDSVTSIDQLQKSLNISEIVNTILEKDSVTSDDTLNLGTDAAEDKLAAASGSGVDDFESVNAKRDSLHFISQSLESSLTMTSESIEGVDNFEHDTPVNPFDFAYTEDQYDMSTSTIQLDFKRS